MFIVTSKVKKRVKELGLRCNEGFLNQLEVAVEIMIKNAAEYTRPKKTITADELAAYMAKHNLKS